MEIKKYDHGNLTTRLDNVCDELERIVAEYQNDYATYGWDSFSETVTNVSAQLYMMRVMLENAKVQGHR